MPVLSPLGLDPAHPFPKILNKSLNLVVVLKGKDAFGRSGHLALVRAPRSLPRIIQLPKKVSGGEHDFVFLSSVLSEFRSEEHTSELQSLMRISYAVFCLQKKKQQYINTINTIPNHTH